MTSQEMMKTKIGPDKIFYNVSAVDEQPNWIIKDKPSDWGVPINDGYTLFGYSENEFMRKQYR